MHIIFWLLYLLVSIYLLTLIVRAILDWISLLSSNFRPRGILLIMANIVYLLTDPPLRALRNWIPPLRLGSVALDMGFLILFISLALLQGVFLRLAALYFAL